MTDRRRRDTRERLVDAAIDLFRRNGPTASGLAAVCARAGTTKGVLGHHFPEGKDQLLLAALVRNAADVDAVLEDLLARDGATVGSTIRGFFDFYGTLIDGDADFGCPLAAAVVDGSSGSGAVRELLDARFARWIALLTDQQVREGRPRRKASAFATTTVAAMEGAILLSRVEGNGKRLRTTGEWLGAAADAS